jgi:hypothetical protein
VSRESILGQARSLLALSGENETRAEGLYAELIGLYHDQFRDRAFADVADEITRLVESDIALQKTRTSLLGALEACLKSSNNQTDDAEYLAKVSDPTLRSYTGIALEASLNEVDLDALDGNRTREDRGPSMQFNENERRRSSGLVARSIPTPKAFVSADSSDGPQAQSRVAASEPSDGYDPWASLNIRDLHASGAPEPIPPLPAERLATISPGTRPPTNQYSPPMNTGDQSDELERALDTLLSKPPQGVPPPLVGGQARQNDTTTRSKFQVSLSAVIQSGRKLVASRVVDIGPQRTKVMTWERVPTEQPVHVFFELPNGAQLGVNCRVDSEELRPGIHGKYLFELIYLDLTASDRAVLLSQTGIY